MNNELNEGNLEDQSRIQQSEGNTQTKIPVIEEYLQADKKTVETGRVSVTKQVHEEEESIRVPLVHEEVEVKRVEINQYVDSAPPAIRHEGDITIIPILKEVLVVEKKLMLVEEVHIRKQQIQTTSEHRDTVRKEEIVINRTNPNQSY